MLGIPAPRVCVRTAVLAQGRATAGHLLVHALLRGPSLFLLGITLISEEELSAREFLQVFGSDLRKICTLVCLLPSLKAAWHTVSLGIS